VAINDVLPMKAARRDAAANLNCFGAPRRHQRLNFDGFIYIGYAASRHLIRLASAPFTSYFWIGGLVWFGSVCWPPYAKAGD